MQHSDNDEEEEENGEKNDNEEEDDDEEDDQEMGEMKAKFDRIINNYVEDSSFKQKPIT